MKYLFRATGLILALAFSLSAQEAAKSPPTDWEKSVVRVEISRKTYDYYQPWNRRNDRVLKVGLVLDGRRILTTAQDVSDSTLLRVQKDGRGPWTTATLEWVDYHANLALVTTGEAAFWEDLQPATLADLVPAEGDALQVLRWREGKLENRRAEFMQTAVRQSELSSINHVRLEMDSEIQGVGWGEPVVVNSRVIGLIARQHERACEAIPASFIRPILEAHRSGSYRGLGYFHFYWQPAGNTASLSHLRLPGKPRGVLVTHAPERLDGLPSVLQPLDILLQIDGFDVDMQGDYRDPQYGATMLENLAVRGRWAGDEVKLQVWREGRQLDLNYRLPKYEYTHALVPREVFDQSPEYLILGGLVFQPLVQPYLERWGAEWERRAPFRLTYFTDDDASKEKPAVVIISQVLPDPYNIGYQDQRGRVVTKVNGQPVRTLTDVREALKQPIGDFHVVDFLPDEAAQRIVLGAAGAEHEATRRVLQRYGIAEEACIAAKAAKP